MLNFKPVDIKYQIVTNTDINDDSIIFDVLE